MNNELWLERAAYIEQLEKQNAELLAAMQKAADQIRVCDYTPARSTLLVALENAKPAKGSV